MDIEEVQAIHDAERAQRAEIAGKKVFEMGLPLEVDTPDEIFGLGTKTEKIYAKTRQELFEELGTGQSKIMAVALHEYWFACWDGAAFIQISIDDKSFNDNEYTRNLATAEGYAKMHGWASTLADGFADIVPSAGRQKWIKLLTDHDILDYSIALRCMAIYWFNQASIVMKSGNIAEACDLLHEANDALSIDFSNRVWNDAWNDATKNAEENLLAKNPDANLKIDEEVARRISEKARKAALASHRENHQLKADVFKWCEENRLKGQSRSKAARIISGGLMPIIYTTAYDYITDWDKSHPERLR